VPNHSFLVVVVVVVVHPLHHLLLLNHRNHHPGPKTRLLQVRGKQTTTTILPTEQTLVVMDKITMATVGMLVAS